MGKIIKTVIKRDQKLTRAQIAEIREAKKYPIVFDEDSPEYSLAELKQMHEAAIKKRAEQNKEVVALRLSPATIKKAKSLGKGYTSFLSRLIDNAIKDKDLVAQSL